MKGGHEIGHHGDLHESVVGLSRDEEEKILKTGIDTIQQLIGKRVKGYRSPAADHSQNTVGLLEEYEFKWDSSLLGDDFRPYMIREDKRETEIVELPFAWELDDAAHYLFNFFPKYIVGMSSPSKVFEIWSSEFDGAYLENGIFILTMHPQLTGRYHRFVMLERLIQYISGHPDVWFASLSEIADDWLKHKRR